MPLTARRPANAMNTRHRRPRTSPAFILAPRPPHGAPYASILLRDKRSKRCRRPLNHGSRRRARSLPYAASSPGPCGPARPRSGPMQNQHRPHETAGPRRVLMVAFQFPPFAMSSGVQRTLRFVQHLPALGWQPIVLSAHPRVFAATSADLLKEIPPGTVVERAFALDAA